MPFNANFDSVTLVDGALEVVGTSQPANATTAIAVTLVHGTTIRTQDVAEFGNASWRVTFPPDPEAFKDKDTIFLVGLALREGQDPFTWPGGFVVTADANLRHL